MLDWNIFEEIVVEKLGRDIRPEVNPDQDKAINAPINESQFIVAGRLRQNHSNGPEYPKIHLRR